MCEEFSEAGRPAIYAVHNKSCLMTKFLGVVITMQIRVLSVATSQRVAQHWPVSYQLAKWNILLLGV
jgi:hypothetical protein